MPKLSVSFFLVLTSLTGCQQDNTSPSIQALLPGDWHQQQVTFYHYALDGTLQSQQTSAAGPNNQLIVTDSTIAYYSEVSIGPGPGPTPGRWVVRRYALQSDTIHYENSGWPEVIKELSAHQQVLHHPGKASINSGLSTGYSEYDATYTR